MTCDMPTDYYAPELATKPRVCFGLPEMWLRHQAQAKQHGLQLQRRRNKAQSVAQDYWDNGRSLWLDESETTHASLQVPEAETTIKFPGWKG